MYETVDGSVPADRPQFPAMRQSGEREDLLLRDDGALTPLAEASYEFEDVLQRLLADHPDLLAGEQMNEAAPRR